MTSSRKAALVGIQNATAQQQRAARCAMGWSSLCSLPLRRSCCRSVRQHNTNHNCYLSLFLIVADEDFMDTITPWAVMWPLPPPQPQPQPQPAAAAVAGAGAQAASSASGTASADDKEDAARSLLEARHAYSFGERHRSSFCRGFLSGHSILLFATRHPCSTAAKPQAVRIPQGIMHCSAFNRLTIYSRFTSPLLPFSS